MHCDAQESATWFCNEQPEPQLLISTTTNHSRLATNTRKPITFEARGQTKCCSNCCSNSNSFWADSNNQKISFLLQNGNKKISSYKSFLFLAEIRKQLKFAKHPINLPVLRNWGLVKSDSFFLSILWLKWGNNVLMFVLAFLRELPNI